MRIDLVEGEAGTSDGGFIYRLMQELPTTFSLLELIQGNKSKNVQFSPLMMNKSYIGRNNLYQDDFVHEQEFASVTYEVHQVQMIPYLNTSSQEYPSIAQALMGEQVLVEQNPKCYTSSEHQDMPISEVNYTTLASLGSSSSCSTFASPPEVWLRRSAGSIIDFRMLSVEKVACLSTQIEIEVVVKDGVVFGTKCLYDDLFKSVPPVKSVDKNTEGTIFFESRFGSLIFRKLMYHYRISMDTFDVEVVSLSRDSRIIMESMTDVLWTKLQDMITASLYFNNCTKVRYHLPPNSEQLNAVNGITEYKKIFLTVGMENVAKYVTAGVETFDFYRSLPLEDQIILTKEGVVGVSFLFLLLLYDKKQNCKIHTAFEDQLEIHASLDILREEPLAIPIADCFRIVSSSMYDFLQKDHFVIYLFVLLFFFQAHAGLSFPDVIYKERIMFFNILAKYIRGKIKAGEWKESYDDIWNNITSMKPHISSLNHHFTAMARAIEKAINIH
jgi:hypothetical protein